MYRAAYPSGFYHVLLLLEIDIVQQDIRISTGQQTMLPTYQEGRASPDGPLAELDRFVRQHWTVVRLHKHRNDNRQSD